MPTIRELINQSEKEREEGKLSEALIRIDHALSLAGEQADYVQLLEALAHKLEIWKYFHAQTGQGVFWELLKGDAETGLQIADRYEVQGHPRAVMLLRRGTYEMFNKNYLAAVDWFARAFKVLPSDEKVGTRAEFLGHLGEAEAQAGLESGIPHLEQALAEVQSATDMREFHKMVIESGIHLRMAKVCMEIHRTREATTHWQVAQDIATALATEHAMPARLTQCQQFAEAYKL